MRAKGDEAKFAFAIRWGRDPAIVMALNPLSNVPSELQFPKARYERLIEGYEAACMSGVRRYGGPMRVTTISPLYVPLQLLAGIDPRTAVYREVVKALPAHDPEIHAPNRELSNKAEFDDLNLDDYDLRILVWTPQVEEDEPQASFHLYPNGLFVVEASFELEVELDSDLVQSQAQSVTRNCVDQHAQRLNEIIFDFTERLPENLQPHSIEAKPISSDSISWISRAVTLDPSTRKMPEYQTFFRDWLKETVNPLDAEDLISGESDSAISWVNYVILESSEQQTSEAIACIRMAQYFFAAQSSLNDRTQETLTNSLLTPKVREARQMLSDARDDMQFLAIQFAVHKSYMRRSRRRLFDHLLEAWEFKILTENGQRMIDACTSKLDQIAAQRVERGTFVTDLILAAIALLTVIDVSLYMTEYSRKMMSQPALGYNDSGLSWILSSIASIDTDLVLLGGFISIVILVLIYAYWKLRR